MMPDELAPWVEKHPVAPEGWEPLAMLPITTKLPIEYLCEDDSTHKTIGVTNLDFVCRSPPKAWRHLTSGRLYDWYWASKKRNALAGDKGGLLSGAPPYGPEDWKPNG